MTADVIYIGAFVGCVICLVILIWLGLSSGLGAVKFSGDRFEASVLEAEILEIRCRQDADLADIESQLADGADPVFVFGQQVSPEAAWATATSIRKAFELDARWDGAILGDDETWYARLEDGREIRIGRYAERAAA